jgi:hypothetical protein
VYDGRVPIVAQLLHRQIVKTHIKGFGHARYIAERSKDIVYSALLGFADQAPCPRKI